VADACTGAEGIRLFRDSPADVVVTDLYMADGDGFEVMTTVRRHVPVPKIIAISGQSGTKDMLHAAKLLGADVILPKPLQMNELLAAVETVLRHIRP
jgi:DNA-binding response OmpR family regulator